MLNSEGIGNVKTVLSETKAQQPGSKGKESSKVIAGNKGANVRDSPLETQVQTRSAFIPWTNYSESVRMFSVPGGVAVNDSDEIDVAESNNNRISVFRSDGTHLISFGRKGRNNEEINYPTGVAFDSLGNILVADCVNHRVQGFDVNDKFISKFGEKGNLDHQLGYPEGLSVNCKRDIIVAEKGLQQSNQDILFYWRVFTQIWWSRRC